MNEYIVSFCNMHDSRLTLTVSIVAETAQIAEDNAYVILRSANLGAEKWEAFITRDVRYEYVPPKPQRKQPYA